MPTIRWIRLCVVIFLLFLPAAGCSALPASSPPTSATAVLCADPWKVMEDFYSANDTGNYDDSLNLLTDDVVLVSWATGANGYHMSPRFSIGKNQVREHLGEPGLRRPAVDPSRPNFTVANRDAAGNTLRFQLLPDRLRDNGRPFNHYSIELVFNGCLIEILKVVERVTWL